MHSPIPTWSVFREHTRSDFRERRRSLIETIRQLCVFVEFPIEIDDMGRRETIRSAPYELAVISWRDPLDPKADYKREFFPINRRGLEGGFSVVTKTVSGRTEWEQLTEQQRIGSPVDLDGHTLVAINGIAYRGARQRRADNRPLRPMIDVRRDSVAKLSRSAGFGVLNSPEVQSRIREILESHLGKPKKQFDFDEWRYRVRVAQWVPKPTSYWRCRSDMVPHYAMGRLRLCSLDHLMGQDTFFLPATRGLYYGAAFFADESAVTDSLRRGAFALHTEVTNGSHIWSTIDSETELRGVSEGPEGTPLAELQRSSTSRTPYGPRVRVIPIARASYDIVTFGDKSTAWIVINEESAFGAWWRDMERSRVDGRLGLQVWDAFVTEVSTGARWEGYRSAIPSAVASWNNAAAIPAQFRCPVDQPTVFTRRWASTPIRQDHSTRTGAQKTKGRRK